MPTLIEALSKAPRVLVHQRFEGWEWLGFETRNRYEILGPDEKPIGYAAEQGKGFLGLLFRQFLGHWRKFDVQFYSANRMPAFKAHHPFRWYFERLEITGPGGEPWGVIQKRFKPFFKRFDLLDETGALVLSVDASLLRIWTFAFMRYGNEQARVAKKWHGLFFEAFTDRDKFLVEYLNPELDLHARALVLAAAVFIDLQYFETKAKSKWPSFPHT